MNKVGPSASSSSNPYAAGKDVIGFAFDYPTHYFSLIESDDRDIDAGGDGIGLSFLTALEAAEDLKHFVRKVSSQRLVPFARGDNGDALYCFDGRQTGDIYVINLGERPLKMRRTGFSSLMPFINDYRANLGLPPWSSIPGTADER